MNEEKTIQVFCVEEQCETPHQLDIDGNGELVVTCTSNIGTEDAPAICGRFLKFPKGITSEELKIQIQSHKESNQGQISVRQIEAQKEELLKGLVDSI